MTDIEQPSGERDETTAEKLAVALRARADWLDLPRDVEAPRPYISREQFRAAANLLDEIERLREALVAARHYVVWVRDDSYMKALVLAKIDAAMKKD